MKFTNPTNNYTEEVHLAFLWTLLFGALYFLVKGVWTHALISLILAIVTSGFSWLIYPFFARGVMRTHFLKKGWIEV